MGDGGGGHWLILMEWRPSGWSVCLRLLIFPCPEVLQKQLAPADPGGPGKRAVKRLWWWWFFPLLCSTHVYNIVLYVYRWNEAFRSSLVNSRVETNKQLVEAIVNAKHRPKVWVSTSAVGK